MAGWTIPNEASASSPDQSEIDTGDFAVLTNGVAGNGVISGLVVTPHGSPNMSLAVAAGIAKIGKTAVSVIAGNTPTITADGTNPRYVFIEIDTSGTIGINAGTAAAKPVFPTSSVNKVVIAAIRVAAATTALGSGTIIDKRVFISTGNKTNIYATDYGLGDGVTSDNAALDAFFAALSGAFTQVGLDRAGSGIKGILPAGTWVYTPAATGTCFPVIAPTGTNAGSITIEGQGSGSTTLTTSGALGHKLTMSGAATRGSGAAGVSGSLNPGANGITLSFGTAHGGVEGQTIALQVTSRGRKIWCHYSIIDPAPGADNTKLIYGVASATTTADLNLVIPPTGDVYFCEYMVEPLNFSTKGPFFIDKLTLQAGTNTDTPTDGFGIRMTARVNVMPDCQVRGFWMGASINGTVHGGQGSQNTDHNFIYSRDFQSNQIALGFIDNSKSSWPSQVGTGLGGGRDNHLLGANFGGTGLYSITVNDGGSFQTLDVSSTNMKGGSSPLFFEGVDGVDPVEPLGIDGIEGWVKFEGSGNWSFALDETKRRIFQKSLLAGFRIESSVDINGADQGTPGGAGTVPQGTFNDFTDKPWTATNVSLKNIASMPTITADVPAAMFGGDGGCDIGTIVVIGLAQRASTDSGYASDGITVVSGKKFQSATAKFTQDDVNLRIDCAGLTGGSDTIASWNSATEVVMKNNVTAATGQAWTIRNDGTKNQASVNHEGRVATTDYVSPAAGLCRITMPFPTFNGTFPDSTTIYTAIAGELGCMRVGSLHAWDTPMTMDTPALDRMCRSSMFFDLKSLSSGNITMIQDDINPAPRKALPSFRIWDALARRKIDGVANTTTTFTSATAKFNQDDVGKSLSCVGIGLPSDTTTIASVTNKTTVIMNDAATSSATGLTFTVGAAKAIPPFRFSVTHGQNKFYLYKHAQGDTNAIVKGGYCEFTSGSSGNLDLQSSVASRVKLGAGVAMGASGVGALPGVSTTVGAIFNAAAVGSSAARVFFDSPTLLVAQYPTVLSLTDETNQLIASGSIAAGSLLADKGDGSGQVVQVALTTGVPTAGQRIVGQAIALATTGNPVAAVICHPYWT